MVMKKPSGEQLAGQVIAEFRAHWVEEEEWIGNELAKAANEAGINGMGRSTVLLQVYAKVYKEGLRKAHSLFMHTAERIIQVNAPDPDQSIHKAIEASYRQLITELSVQFNNDTKSRANTIGFGNLGDRTPNVANTRDALLSSASSEVGSLMQQCTKPEATAARLWYERPVGLIVIATVATVVGGILLFWLL